MMTLVELNANKNQYVRQRKMDWVVFEESALQIFCTEYKFEKSHFWIGFDQN